MRRVTTILACALLAVGCGGANTKSAADGAAEGEVKSAESEIRALEEQLLESADVDVEALSIEDRVEYYLTRYSHEATLNDSARAEATKQEMVQWLNSLTDAEKRLADDASDAWYGRNADRI